MSSWLIPAPAGAVTALSRRVADRPACAIAVPACLTGRGEVAEAHVAVGRESSAGARRRTQGEAAVAPTTTVGSTRTSVRSELAM